VRSLILSGVIAAGLSVLVFARQFPQLSYVATANQFGVVGYRDPVGAISPDGTRLAYSEGRFIRVVPIAGGAPVTLAPGEGQIRSLEWIDDTTIAAEDRTPGARWWRYRLGDAARGPLPDRPRSHAACILEARISLKCDGTLLKVDPDRDVYGPIAFAPDGDTVYFSSPNDRGMVELWSAEVTTRRARRISNFSRDAYAPSVSSDGTVVFKTQTYRTHLADIAFEGGPTRQLTAFQSETPSYHPTRPLIAFTYGTWRRVVDDAKYPDIAQEIGVIELPDAAAGVSRRIATAPSQVLEDSDSEDQAMTWSPNGRWIAFHSHRDMSDDIWLRPAERSAGAPAAADRRRRLTFLGRGAEVGWPRWSPDGKTVLLNGARKSDPALAKATAGQAASVLYTIGVNQDTGATTSELREIKVAGITGEMGHAEWMPDSASVTAIVKERAGRQAIITVPAAGGRATIVHRFESEHDFSGLGVSANGRFVAFAAPAPDGFFQIFVKAVGQPTPAAQLTTDPSHKTQPAFSPDGSRVAFTVWSYTSTFWAFAGR
jgi:Tol biopolymer transport system component